MPLNRMLSSFPLKTSQIRNYKSPADFIPPPLMIQAPPLVLVDVGHSRSPHVGLGQVAMQYARALVARPGVPNSDS